MPLDFPTELFVWSTPESTIMPSKNIGRRAVTRDSTALKRASLAEFVALWRNTVRLPANSVAGEDTDSAVGAWVACEEVGGTRPMFPGGLRQIIRY